MPAPEQNKQVVDLSQFSTISDSAYMHDCDSGGPNYVSFDVTEF